MSEAETQGGTPTGVSLTYSRREVRRIFGVALLVELQEAGYVTQTADGGWRLTQAGKDRVEAMRDTAPSPPARRPLRPSHRGISGVREALVWGLVLVAAALITVGLLHVWGFV